MRTLKIVIAAAIVLSIMLFSACNEIEKFDENPTTPTVGDFTVGRNVSSYFVADMGVNGKMEVSCYYSADTGCVNEITTKIVITESHPQYYSLSAELESYVDMDDGLYDDKLTCYHGIYNNDVNFTAWFEDLDASDSSDRIAVFSRLYGVYPNSADGKLYFSDVKNGLLQMGFNMEY